MYSKWNAGNGKLGASVIESPLNTPVAFAACGVGFVESVWLAANDGIARRTETLKRRVL